VNTGVRAGGDRDGGESGIEILIVDDEPKLAELGARRLESLGYRVTALCDSRAALDLILSDPRRFGLVITDLLMPGLSGLELARQATEARPGLPVIVLTGLSEEHAPAELEAAGVARVLGKPLRLADLDAAIREVLS